MNKRTCSSVSDVTVSSSSSVTTVNVAGQILHDTELDSIAKKARIMAMEDPLEAHSEGPSIIARLDEDDEDEIKAAVNAIWVDYGRFIKHINPVVEMKMKAGKDSTCYVNFDEDVPILDGSCGTIAQPDVAALKKLSGPAAFGHGMLQKYDHTVRKGYQIDVSFDAFLGKIATSALIRIADSDSNSDSHFDHKRLYAVPYRLHLYETGGHFIKHVDTPHGENHYATLIISLGSVHTGGALVIEDVHNSKDYRVSFENGKRRAVFFYPDMPHCVEPVTSGTRVVLQADVYVNTKCKGPKAFYWDEDSTCSSRCKCNRVPGPYGDKMAMNDKCNVAPLVQKLCAFVVREDSYTPVIVLSHCYIERGLRPEFLRGSDRVLWDALCAYGKFRPSLTFVDIEEERCPHTCNRITGIRALTGVSGCKKLILVTSTMKSPGRLVLKRTPSADFAGNEPLNGYGRYLCAGLVVQHLSE